MDAAADRPARLSTLDRLLPLWIGVAMAVVALVFVAVRGPVRVTAAGAAEPAEPEPLVAD